MWSCESTACTFPHRWKSGRSALGRDFAVGERLFGVDGNEQKSGATRREPAREQLRRAADGGFGEQRLRPAANVTQLGCAAREHAQRRGDAVRRAQEMRDRVTALHENIRAHSRLVVQQSTFVWIGGWGGPPPAPE